MKILIGITYYVPNVSGVTIYARRLAEELVKKGHEVTVLTSHHLKSLPEQEKIGGVKIVRSPVLFKIGKGVILPRLPVDVLKIARGCDVIVCHLPQFESFVFAIIGRLLGKKVFLTHHTDLSGWSGLLNRLSEGSVWVGQLIAGLFADKIVPYTKDYADYSWYLKLFKRKLEYVFPPIISEKVDKKARQKFVKKIGETDYVIGFAGRIAKQKGIPHLLKAIPVLRKKLSSFKIVFAGPYQEVIGENYFNEIKKLIERYREDLCFLGNIPEEKMSAFYDLCDVLVLPSDDRLESFGIVQVEAMLNSCPVVASDLPGVRVPIQLTNMGKLVEPGRSHLLADKIVKVLKNKQSYLRPRNEIENVFSVQGTVRSYEDLFRKK